MKLAWDYSGLAKTYDKRADYDSTAWQQFEHIAGIRAGAQIADIGAGTGKLSKLLLARGHIVSAVEPNDAMRALGSANTAGLCIQWSNATAEETALPTSAFRAVSFGSSFNVVDQQAALREAARILLADGWIVCVWNHRVLDDPIQAQVESVIHRLLPGYRYGRRRESQAQAMTATGHFAQPLRIESTFARVVSVRDYVDAWRSHGTLARQAGCRFEEVVAAISRVVSDRSTIRVPYRTLLWCSQRYQGIPLD